MVYDKSLIESNLRVHVDRLAGLIGARTLRKPKTIQATIGYLEGQWSEMGYRSDRETYEALGDQATNLRLPAKNRPTSTWIRWEANTMRVKHANGVTRSLACSV